MADSQRQEKVARLVQKDLSEILKNVHFGIPQGSLVTVTKVRVSPDLGLARIYLSIWPGEPDAILNRIKLSAREIRHALGLKVRNQLRVVPDLQFYLDDSMDYYEKIDAILKDK